MDSGLEAGIAMPDPALAPAVWDALHQLAFQDGERVAVAAELAHAKERAARDLKLEEVRVHLTSAQHDLAAASSERRAREAEIEDLNLRVTRTEDRLASGKLHTEREVLAAQTELDRLRAAIGEAESAWIAASGREDTYTASLPELRAAVQVEEREAALRLATIQREITAAETRLAAIDKLRRDAAQAIPTEVRDRYRALFPRTGGRPFAWAEAGHCSHCHRSLPAAVVQMLRVRTGVPNCPSCGRLLLAP